VFEIELIGGERVLFRTIGVKVSWSFVVFLHKTENTSTFGAIAYMLFPLCTDTCTHVPLSKYPLLLFFFKKTNFSVFEKVFFFF